MSEQIEAQIIGYRLNGWNFPAFKEKIVDTLKYALIFPQKYSASCINSKFNRGDLNRAAYQNNALDKGHMFFGWNERTEAENGDADINFVPDKRVDYYLRKLIALCTDRKIPVFIEHCPMNTASHARLAQTNFYPAFRSYFLRLAKETGVSVETEIPCFEPECFGDSSHVNLRGAERFTAEIKAKYGL